MDVELRPRGERQRRADRRDRSRGLRTARVPARARVRRDSARSGPSGRARACWTASTGGAEYYGRRLGGLAARPAVASTSDRVNGAARSVPGLAPPSCAPTSRRPASRRPHREPLDSVGLLQRRRRSRRLSPGLAARPGRERRRTARRRGRPRRRAACSPTCGHPGGRRPLAAEHVARRHALLDRHPDGRDRPSRSCWSTSRTAMGALDRDRAAQLLWPMVRRAAGVLVRNGPGHPAGSLGGGSRLLAVHPGGGDRGAARRGRPRRGNVRAGACRATSARPPTPGTAAIERWTYVTDTDSRAQIGVEGYYVRIAPPDDADAASPATGFVPIKNRPPGEAARARRADRQPGRAGPGPLRAPGRRRSRASSTPSRSSTALLKVDTPVGPAWRRYNGDGYGEHEDGSPFDGTGIGRAWPLLTGERAHYELAAGRREEAEAPDGAPSHGSPAKAGCCPNRSGTRPTFPSGSCSSASPPAPPCPWSGPTLSTSSCAAPWPMAGSSTCRRRPCSGTRS